MAADSSSIKDLLADDLMAFNYTLRWVLPIKKKRMEHAFLLAFQSPEDKDRVILGTTSQQSCALTAGDTLENVSGYLEGMAEMTTNEFIDFITLSVLAPPVESVK